MNQSGFLSCEATRVGEDTTLSQIIQMVSDAAATKAPIAKIADRVSGVFVPAVITIAVVTIAVWLICRTKCWICTGQRNFGTGYQLPVCTWTCNTGCHYGRKWYGRQNGIMFKTAVSLEETGKMQIVALIKPERSHSGEPKVTDMIRQRVLREELLTMRMHWRRRVNIHWQEQFFECKRGQNSHREVSDFPGGSGKWPDRQIKDVLAGRSSFGKSAKEHRYGHIQKKAEKLGSKQEKHHYSLRKKTR